MKSEDVSRILEAERGGVAAGQNMALFRGATRSLKRVLRLRINPVLQVTSIGASKESQRTGDLGHLVAINTSMGRYGQFRFPVLTLLTESCTLILTYSICITLGVPFKASKHRTRSTCSASILIKVYGYARARLRV